MTMLFLAFYVMMGASALYTEKEAICQPGAQCSQENSLHAPGKVSHDPLDHSFAQLAAPPRPFSRAIATKIAKAYANKYGEDSADLGIAIFQYCVGLRLNADEAIILETYALNHEILDAAEKKSKSGLLAFLSVMDDYLENQQDDVELRRMLALSARKVKIENKIKAIEDSSRVKVPDHWGPEGKGKYPREAVYNMLLRRVFGDGSKEEEQDAALAALESTAVREAVEADLVARGWREIPDVVYPSYERMLHDTADIRERWHERQRMLGAV
jgi:hypothetical protein